MNEYAVITSGYVTDILVADQSFIDEFYPGSPQIDQLNPKPGIGWAYDGANFTPPSTSPPVTVAPQPPTVFDTQGFRARYTLDELIATDNYAQWPGISTADAQQMLTIKQSFATASQIDITAQNVIDSVNFEASLGMITTQRAAEILDPNSAPPTKAWKI